LAAIVKLETTYMRLIAFLAVAILISTSIQAQFVAKVQIKEHIDGLCNEKEVYSLFPGFDTSQVEAKCPVTDEEILRRLDSAVTFLKEKPHHKDKGMVSIMINCKGDVVKCEMDNKTKSATMDSQIVAVFSSLGSWKAGLLAGKPVDSMRLFSFEIKDGKISM
jgi:hypothetical protein